MKTKTLLAYYRRCGRQLDRLAAKDPNWTPGDQDTMRFLLEERRIAHLELQFRSVHVMRETETC